MSVLSRLANPKIREFAVRLRQPVSISTRPISLAKSVSIFIISNQTDAPNGWRPQMGSSTEHSRFAMGSQAGIQLGNVLGLCLCCTFAGYQCLYRFIHRWRKIGTYSRGIWTRRMGIWKETNHKVRIVQDVPTSFEQEFSKKSLTVTKAKKSWRFVYILAKRCRSPFNLTNFQNSGIWDFH